MSSGEQLKVVLDGAHGFYFSGVKAAKRESDAAVKWLNTELKGEAYYRELCGSKGKLAVGFNFPPKEVGEERAKEIMSRALDRIGQGVDRLNDDNQAKMAGMLMRGTQIKAGSIAARSKKNCMPDTRGRTIRSAMRRRCWPVRCWPAIRPGWRKDSAP